MHDVLIGQKVSCVLLKWYVETVKIFWLTSWLEHQGIVGVTHNSEVDGMGMKSSCDSQRFEDLHQDPRISVDVEVEHHMKQQ